MKDKKTEKPMSKKDEAAKLKELLGDLQKEKDELFEKLQRVSADYANFQKRAPKQIADSVAYEREKIIKTLLPAMDNFEHTLQNADTVESVEDLLKGVRIIHDQMLDILKSHKVEQIHSIGETFDPSLHQAMMHRSQAESEDNTVLEEFQKGYKLNDRVIRPSKVVINKIVTQQQEQLEKKPEKAVESGEQGSENQEQSGE